jgi:hypothetical protein
MVVIYCCILKYYEAKLNLWLWLIFANKSCIGFGQNGLYWPHIGRILAWLFLLLISRLRAHIIHRRELLFKPYNDTVVKNLSLLTTHELTARPVQWSLHACDHARRSRVIPSTNTKEDIQNSTHPVGSYIAEPGTFTLRLINFHQCANHDSKAALAVLECTVDR